MYRKLAEPPTPSKPWPRSALAPRVVVVGTLTRFWIVDAAVGELDVDGVLPAHVFRTADEPELTALAALAFDLRLERVRDVLERWAGAHPEAELLVVADSLWVSAAACAAVGLDRDAIRARAATVDWPGDDDERPALVGLDLDWRPRFGSKDRPRYPGGPGSAPAGRA